MACACNPRAGSSLANQPTLTEGLQADFPTCLHPYTHTHTYTCTHHLHIQRKSILKQATVGFGSLYCLLSEPIVAILILNCLVCVIWNSLLYPRRPWTLYWSWITACITFCHRVLRLEPSSWITACIAFSHRVLRLEPRASRTLGSTHTAKCPTPTSVL